MQKFTVYKINVDAVPAGVVSVRKEAAGRYFLSALCVIPAYAGKGIGQRAMRFLDTAYPDAVHWALETPTDKKQNHYFYQKFGYRVTREYQDGSVPISYFERVREMDKS